MNTEAIAHRLVELVRDKQFLQAQEELFDPKATSDEPDTHPRPKTVGLANILKKEKGFLAQLEKWIQFEVSEPIISKDHFAVRMYTHATMKDGIAVAVDEIVVYEVSGGKIINEKYFYQMPGH